MMHETLVNGWLQRITPAPRDEVFISSLTVASFFGLLLAFMNRILRTNLLSRLAERVIFVMIPPLVLVFLVLGTIFLGIATPTEGGAMGAIGALVMAAGRRKINMKLLKQALETTATLSCFVVFILIAATIFSFTFNAADGHLWVERLFEALPGDKLAFIIVVNILVFVLGMFLDFFEIAFIVIPMLAPVAEKMDIDLIWFGIIIALNLQTSFLTPPFGFALFFLRSVAANKDYDDPVTGRRISRVTSEQIYKGAIPFIVLQLLVIGLLVAFPELTNPGSKTEAVLNEEEVMKVFELQSSGGGQTDLMQGLDLFPTPAPAPDPTQSVLDAINQN